MHQKGGRENFDIHLFSLMVAMQNSFPDFEYSQERERRQTRRDRFLAEIEACTPWADLVAVLEPFYPKSGQRGRPPVGLERMLRMYIAQNCFGLSDEGMEDAIYDSHAIRQFVGIDLGRESAPDATLIAAPPSTKNRDKQRDPEMHQTKKGNQWYFGMKAHIGVDADSGLVHTLVTTSANVHDVTQAGALLHGEERDVFGDAGYSGVDKREENKERKVTWHVAMHRGLRRALPDNEWGKKLDEAERKKAQIRARVEHPFHVIKNRLKFRKTRYRGLAKNTAQLFTLFGLANLALAAKRLLGLQGRGASSACHYTQVDARLVTY